MTKFSHAARLALISVVCAAVIVLIAACWVRRTHQTGSVGGPGEQNHSSKEHFAILTWKPSPSVVVGYNVYRAEDPRGPYKKLNRAPVPEATYKDAEVRSGHSYFYMVTAVDAKGRESGFSNQVRATLPSP